MSIPQFIYVSSSIEAILLMLDKLYQKVDDQTVLFLSGGKTPKPLYEKLAQQKRIISGAVAMVDDRLDGSNEKMIKDTGLIEYLNERGVQFYSILGESPLSGFSERIGEGSDGPERPHPSLLLKGEGIIQTAESYNRIIQMLFAKFPKRVGIFGVGADGHTAGLPAQKSHIKYQKAKINETEFVTFHNQMIGGVQGRITLTFTAMEQLDQLIVLVFGEDKIKALRQMLLPGSEAEIPARFYTRPEIAKKTIIITDQMV